MTDNLKIIYGNLRFWVTSVFQGIWPNYLRLPVIGVAANILEPLPRLLCSKRLDIRYKASCLIWNLVKHKPAHRACSRETCSEHETVVNSVLDGLPMEFYGMQQAGAEALVTSGRLQTRLSELIVLPISQVRQSTCMILEHLAMYQYALPVILEVTLWEQVLSLLHDADGMTRVSAIYALVQVSRWPQGASVLVQLRALEVLQQLGDRTDSWMRDKITTIERNIADRS
ncbi:hypothetical protein FB45DRAFT_868109 [Roridomyces roridus]|uniref:Uncharacterized protein n=1 Tax=Roridomyces roridus TaxID=1738132 RepID=A0AAD7FIU0_9AGAR|nr:hypothetical protein FB45DRAFT_868109 [Roridomyces roridus]